MSKTLGLVMIVKNEGRCLEKCLSSVYKLVDKIFITDTGSQDDTLEIAERFDAHISHFEWEDDFAAARNYALMQSDCDWNLVLDADEYLISGDRASLQKFIEDGKYIGAIQRHDFYRESNGEISKSITTIARVIPRGTLYEGKIHEQVVEMLPIVPISLVFEHDGYLREGKGERNLQILLKQHQLHPKDPYQNYQIAQTMHLLGKYDSADIYFKEFYRLVPDVGTGYRTKGVITYIYNLLELKAYEEGYCLIQAEQEKLGRYADYHFACAIFYVQMILSDIQRYAKYLPKISESYLRCLEIGEIPEHEGVIGTGSFKAAYNLGIWFELNGKTDDAKVMYQMAVKDGYEPAIQRLHSLR